MSFVQNQRNAFGAGGVERRSLEIGPVVRQTFSALGRNIGPFLILSLLLVGLPALMFGLWQASSTLHAIGRPAPAIALSRGLITMTGGLVYLAFSGIFQAAIVHGVVADLNGRRSTFGELVSTGLRFALPAIAISLIFGVVMALGLVLLIVPGLMVATAWIVALPAEVVERTGIMAAFSRSGDLVKGARWRILALLLVYFVAAMILDAVVLALGAVLTHRGLPIASITQSLPGVILSTVIRVFVSMVAATGVAVIYHNLRTAREGVAPADLAAVFD